MLMANPNKQSEKARARQRAVRKRWMGNLNFDDGHKQTKRQSHLLGAFFSGVRWHGEEKETCEQSDKWFIQKNKD